MKIARKEEIINSSLNGIQVRYNRIEYPDGRIIWEDAFTTKCIPRRLYIRLEKEYQKLVNKPVETTNEQPKPATSSCGSEGCDHYKYDHICRCQ